MWPDIGRPLNIAHRGASRMAPENTLAAFRKALELGADGIELDVRLCADGVPVVIHDATVDATTDGTGRVNAMTLAQLKRLDAGSSFSPSFVGQKIPALAEVLETLGDKLLVNIELKAGTAFEHGLEQSVIDLIEEYSAAEHLLLSSFSPFALRRVQQRAPHIPTGLLYSCSRWRLVVRLAHAIMLRPAAALHPPYAIVDRQHLAWARERNFRMHLWTVDNIADLRRFVAWRVDGIMTNTPDRLRGLLGATAWDEG